MGEFQPISNPSRFVASAGFKISSTKEHFSNSTNADEICVRREANMSGTRRKFFQDAAIFGAGLLGMSKTLPAESRNDTGFVPPQDNHAHRDRDLEPGDHKSEHAAGGSRDPILPM